MSARNDAPPRRRPSLALPLSPDSTLVERQLLALKDVAVAATALTRAAGHDSVQTGSLELPLQRGLDLAHLLEALLLLVLHALALLHLLLLHTPLLLPTTAQALAIVRLVPLAEGVGVDLDDGGLGEGVGAHELVVGGVEGDGDDTHFARDALAAPGEVAGVEAQRAELAVAAARAHEMDALGADARVGWLAPFLEGPVFSSER